MKRDPTMIRDDNRLTKSAIEFAGTKTPSFPSNDLRVFLAALKRLGYEPEPLLTAAGLRGSMLDDPDARIPCEAFGAVIGCAMRQRPMKNVGVRIATETPLGAFPLLDYLVLSCDNVGEGFKQLAQYFRLVDTPSSIEVRADEEPIQIVVSAVSNIAAEFSVALNVLHFRRETGGQFHPEWITFAHTPDDPAEIERILGCPVRTATSWNGLAISRDAWGQPLLRRDPVLRGLLEQQADEIIARMPAVDSLAFEVHRVLAKRIAGGDLRIESVAKALLTTTRTLQRRLDAAGLSYKDLVDSTRRETAEKYLAKLSLSIAEVSYLLGYSEPSAFHRAFRRWSGLTPQAYRAAQRQPKAGREEHQAVPKRS